MSMTATLKPGDPVIVVEHDDQTRQPRPGGRRFNATVTSAAGIYLAVRYNDDQQGLSVVGHRTDQFYAESGWRSWDGEFRWRLVPAIGEAAIGELEKS